MSEVRAERAVIVLAGGRGRRLGGETPKALRPLAGRSLLERAVHRVRDWSEEVCVSAPPGMDLPEGDYRVQLHSSPPVEAQVRLAPRDSVTLTLEKSGGVVSPFEQRDELPHTTCRDVMQPESMLGANTAR